MTTEQMTTLASFTSAEIGEVATIIQHPYSGVLTLSAAPARGGGRSGVTLFLIEPDGSVSWSRLAAETRAVAIRMHERIERAKG